MSRFFESFIPLAKRLKKYKIEIFLLLAAVLTASISAGIYLVSQKETADDQEVVLGEKSTVPSPSKLIIDIAGAVEKPDIYEVTAGARLKDALVAAGGLSTEADREFFSRNFNLARIVADQEKIYIPSTTEIQNGMVNKININTATLEELDQLPGIGNLTAQKIIQNRPYKSVEELVSKKVVNKGVYEKIKNLIGL